MPDYRLANKAASGANNDITSLGALSGQQTIPTINLAGGQIAFPATAVPSADPNTMDDYEEGYFNPDITCVTSGGYTLDAANDTLAYTKYGRMVHLQGQLTIASEDSPSGGLQVSLPIATGSLSETADTVYANDLVLREHGDAGIENPLLLYSGGSSLVRLYNITDTGNAEAIDETRVDTTFRIYINTTYTGN